MVGESDHSRLLFVSKEEFVEQLVLILDQHSQPVEVRTKKFRAWRMVDIVIDF